MAMEHHARGARRTSKVVLAETNGQGNLDPCYLSASRLISPSRNPDLSDLLLPLSRFPMGMSSDLTPLAKDLGGTLVGCKRAFSLHARGRQTPSALFCKSISWLRPEVRIFVRLQILCLGRDTMLHFRTAAASRNPSFGPAPRLCRSTACPSSAPSGKAHQRVQSSRSGAWSLRQARLA